MANKAAAREAAQQEVAQAIERLTQGRTYGVIAPKAFDSGMGPDVTAASALDRIHCALPSSASPSYS